MGGTRQAQIGNTILNIGGDIILGVDDLEINSADELVKHVKKKKPGEGLLLKIFRNGETKNIGLILEKKPRVN